MFEQQQQQQQNSLFKNMGVYIGISSWFERLYHIPIAIAFHQNNTYSFFYSV